LHAFHLGLFKGHIWGTLKEKIKAIGRSAIKQVDDLYGQFTSIESERSEAYTLQSVSAFPRWSGLVHFASGIMSISFTDGSKCEDISKVGLFSPHVQMVAEHSPHRFLPLSSTICLKKRHQATSC